MFLVLFRLCFISVIRFRTLVFSYLFWLMTLLNGCKLIYGRTSQEYALLGMPDFSVKADSINIFSPFNPTCSAYIRDQLHGMDGVTLEKHKAIILYRRRLRVFDLGWRAGLQHLSRSMGARRVRISRSARSPKSQVSPATR